MVSNICCFHSYLGKIPMLTNIFQMGWNHQLTRKLHYLAHEKYTSNLGLSQPLQTNHSLASFVDKLGRSTSHHPDYYIFSRESWIKPSFATISHYYWEGGQPRVEFTKLGQLGLDLVFECFFFAKFSWHKPQALHVEVEHFFWSLVFGFTRNIFSILLLHISDNIFRNKI